MWSKAYKTHLNDLVVLQNKAMHIINGVPPRTNMDNFYIDNILTVKHIYNYNIGLFMYKYVNKMTPDVFDNFFSSISDIHQYDTRNATMKLLYITFRGTTRGQKTFKITGKRRGWWWLSFTLNECLDLNAARGGRSPHCPLRVVTAKNHKVE